MIEATIRQWRSHLAGSPRRMDLTYNACPSATGNLADASSTGNFAEDYAKGCATEDLAEFQRLANASPGILTHEEPSGRTILHVVVEAGRLNVAQYLLDEKPAFVDKTYGEEGYTALHLAAKTGKTDIIRAIINKTFAQNPNAEAIKRKTSAGESILHLMAKHGPCTLLAYDLRELARETDEDGNTVLHLSDMKGSIQIPRGCIKSLHIGDGNPMVGLFLSGCFQLPSTEEMEEDMKKWDDYKRKHLGYKYKSHALLQFRFDTLTCFAKTGDASRNERKIGSRRSPCLMVPQITPTISSTAHVITSCYTLGVNVANLNKVVFERRG
ncbi:hypothetical protein EJ110_NYTH14513 [Nymphaea thermarum]|nr:hypothetical protein EJ110_NYTH14513 [Nymphaea thermarum]